MRARPAARACGLAAAVLAASAPAASQLVIQPVEEVRFVTQPLAGNARFGVSAAVSGSTAIVGALLDHSAAPEAGAAYVFERTPSGWFRVATLLASDAEAADQLGKAIALSGDTAVVGAWHESALGEDAGAAYVFVRDGSTWTQQAKLLASDGGESDHFGEFVAIDGDSILVSAPGHDDFTGAVYVFTRTGTTWSQQAQLIPSDDVSFGDALALQGDTAFIGMPGDGELGNTAGAVQVFARSGSAWVPQAKLLPAVGQASERFGTALAVSGETLLVGAPGYSRNGNAPRSGAGYVFVRDGSSWTQQARLHSFKLLPDDVMGRVVALSGDVALLGVPKTWFGPGEIGAAYVFQRTGTAWSELPRIFAAVPRDGAEFGAAVAVSADRAIIGSHGDSGATAGSAYAFDLVPGAECGDGLDNDADGLADAPSDPGCRVAASGFENPACDDGFDNDGDGAVDWDGAGVAAPDPNCTAGWRNQERPQACGLGFELALGLGALAALRRRRRGWLA